MEYKSITEWGASRGYDAKTLWEESKLSQDYDSFSNVWGCTESQSNRLRGIEFKYGLGVFNLVTEYVRNNNWNWKD